MPNIIDIYTEYKKVDDRHNKKYIGLLTINVEFGPEHATEFGVPNEFIAAFSGIVLDADFYAPNFYTNRPKDGDDASVVFHTKLRVKAERSKEIPDKLDMIEMLGGVDGIRATFTRYAELAEEYVKMRQHEEETQRQANAIIRHYTNEACDEAKKVVRYEQRLAALRAEYVAEVAAQIDAKTNDWKAKLAKKDDVITESINLGMDYLKAHAVESAKKTGMFRSVSKDPVDYDIATIDEWLAEKKENAEVPEAVAGKDAD